MVKSILWAAAAAAAVSCGIFVWKRRRRSVSGVLRDARARVRRVRARLPRILGERPRGKRRPAARVRS